MLCTVIKNVIVSVSVDRLFIILFHKLIQGYLKLKGHFVIKGLVLTEAARVTFEVRNGIEPLVLIAIYSEVWYAL